MNRFRWWRRFTASMCQVGPNMSLEQAAHESSFNRPWWDQRGIIDANDVEGWYE